MKKTLFAFLALVALCLIGCEEKRTEAPTGFTAKQVGNTIELTWNRVYDAEDYHIENNSTGMSEFTSSTSFIDKNPKEGLNNYELRACGSAYGWSNSVYVSCNFEKNESGGGGGETSSLPAPTGFTLSQTSSYVQLSWNRVSGASGYYIAKATAYSDWEYYKTTNTSAQFGDLTAGAIYYFSVAAYDSEGNPGEWTEDKTITFSGSGSGGGGGGTTSKPNTPSGVTATASSSYITITWNSVSGADNYNVYRSTSASGTYSFISTAYSTSYTDYNVNEGITYYYKVTAENSAGESGKSASASAKISSSGGGNEQHYGPVITEVSGSVSGNYIIVKWKTKTGSGWGWDAADKIEVLIHDPIGNETYDGWGWRVDGTYTGSSVTSGSHKISGYYKGYKDEYGSVKIAIRAINDYGKDTRTLVYFVDENKWYY